eukprot:sb/3476146/
MLGRLERLVWCCFSSLGLPCYAVCLIAYASNRLRSLSNRLRSPFGLANGLETFHWCHFVGNGQIMGGRRRTFKLYLQPFSRYLALKVLKIGRFTIELKSPTSTPHNLTLAYKMAPVKSL